MKKHYSIDPATGRPYKTTRVNGIGYHLPSNVSKDEWRRTKTKWDKKLKDSGFSDIECMSQDQSGHFLPHLRYNSIERNDNQRTPEVFASTEGYYGYCTSFYECFNFKSLNDSPRFEYRYGLVREFMRLHALGVSYNDMIKALQGVKTDYMIRFNVKPVARRYRMKRSKYWCFTFMEKILETMWLWHATSELGSLTPYDLKFMKVTGINSTTYDKAIYHLKWHPCTRLAEQATDDQLAEVS